MFLKLYKCEDFIFGYISCFLLLFSYKTIEITPLRRFFQRSNLNPRNIFKYKTCENMNRSFKVPLNRKKKIINLIEIPLNMRGYCKKKKS